MTVIAWDGKILASDSMAADGEFFGTNIQKVFRTKAGGLLGCSGDADFRDIVAELDNVSNYEEMPSRNDLAELKTDFGGLLILPDKTIYNIVAAFDADTGENGQWWGEIIRIKQKYASTGHGFAYANAVLAQGGSAIEAVKLACKFSLYCRLPVQTLEFKPKNKEDKEPTILEQPVE